jgi:hypothetical protein
VTRILAFIGCLSLVACATTAGNAPAPYQEYDPPARFDYRFPGTTIVRDEEESTVRRYCPEHGVACVIERTDKLCVVVFNVAYAAQRARILRHENAHCVGWPPDHPR